MCDISVQASGGNGKSLQTAGLISGGIEKDDRFAKRVAAGCFHQRVRADVSRYAVFFFVCDQHNVCRCNRLEVSCQERTLYPDLFLKDQCIPVKSGLFPPGRCDLETIPNQPSCIALHLIDRGHGAANDNMLVKDRVCPSKRSFGQR